MSRIFFFMVHITHSKLSFARTIHKKKNDQGCYNQRKDSRDEKSVQHKVVRAKKNGKLSAVFLHEPLNDGLWCQRNEAFTQSSHTNCAQSPRFLKTSRALQQNCQAIRVNCWPVGTSNRQPSGTQHPSALCENVLTHIALKGLGFIWSYWETIHFRGEHQVI